MCDALRNKSKRRGMTLIELLMVVSIMMILAVVALPRMRPAMENRQIRESARALNVFLSKARMEAIRTGRPCGVLFERNDIEPNACTVMRQVEIPPPYSGDTVDTTVRVEKTSGAGNPVQLELTIGPGASLFSGGLVRVGDLVQLNYQGPWYTITFGVDGDSDGYIDSSPSGFPITLQADVGTDGSVPWSSSAPSDPVPFKILRQPAIDSVFGSIAPTLQLPRGIVVDLQYSGYADSVIYTAADASPGVPPDNPSAETDRFALLYADAAITEADVTFDPATGYNRSPIIVMFSPNGSLHRAYHPIYPSDDPITNPVSQSHSQSLIQPVYLLVGRWERVLSPGPEDGLANWEDLNNLWVAVSPQTGLITAANPHADGLGEDTNGNGTQEVGEPDLNGNGQFDLGVSSTGFLRPVTLSDSRRLVREAQVSQGGR